MQVHEEVDCHLICSPTLHSGSTREVTAKLNIPVNTNVLKTGSSDWSMASIALVRSGSIERRRRHECAQESVIQLRAAVVCFTSVQMILGFQAKELSRTDR